MIAYGQFHKRVLKNVDCVSAIVVDRVYANVYITFLSLCVWHAYLYVAP